MSMNESGGFDISALMGAAQQMQEQLAEAQAKLAETLVTGEAGDGAVRVVLNAGMQFQSVRLDRSVVDVDDIDTLEDLILAAIQKGVSAAEALQVQAMNPGAMGGGFDIEDLLGGALSAGEFDDDEEDDDDIIDVSDDAQGE